MDPKTNFKLIIVQTELERFKFLVRSFLRARLKKVRFPPFWEQQMLQWSMYFARLLTGDYRSTNTPSTSALSTRLPSTPRARSSPPRSCSTLRRTRRSSHSTFLRRFCRSFQGRCRGWMIRRGGSAWWIDRMRIVLFL